MKHNITQRKLNRTTAHRKALLINLSNALIKHEQITTTLPKAKELRPFVEKIITLGKNGDLTSRRKAISILQDKKNINKIFDIIADRYKERSGGYTRIVRDRNSKSAKERRIINISNTKQNYKYTLGDSDTQKL